MRVSRFVRTFAVSILVAVISSPPGDSEVEGVPLSSDGCPRFLATQALCDETDNVAVRRLFNGVGVADLTFSLTFGTSQTPCRAINSALVDLGVEYQHYNAVGAIYSTPTGDATFRLNSQFCNTLFVLKKLAGKFGFQYQLVVSLRETK